MRNLDFSSWPALLSTLAGLAVITLIGVGIRLALMQTVQRRRERENRQINERVRTLIAAYKALGGSFTGNLAVDPVHLRDLKRASMAVPEVTHGAADGDTQARDGGLPVSAPAAVSTFAPASAPASSDDPGRWDRSRRIRDTVEAALADVILLGTEQQVRLAVQAAQQMTEGRPIHTAELVVSLRDFIREVLNLEPVPRGLAIPAQGPARPAGNKGKEGGTQSGKAGTGGGNDGGGGGSGAAAGGMGLGVAAGTGALHHNDEDDPPHS
jgi:heme exporter protein D